MDIVEFMVAFLPSPAVLAAIILVLAAFPIHELGHAFKMRKWGVEMSEISLVGFGPIAWHGKWPSVFGQTPLYVRWFPVGAYVITSEAGTAKMKQLPPEAQCDISGAGVTANFIYALILITLAYCYTWLFRATTPPENALEMLVIGFDCIVFAIVTAAISFCLWHYNHYISSYLYPLLGIGVMYLVARAIWSIENAKQATEIMAGPVGVAQLGANIMSAHADPIVGALMVGFNLSLVIGLSNLLPLHPLDGGHLMVTTLERIMPKAHPKYIHIFRVATVLTVFALVVLVVISDTTRLINWIF